MTLQEILFIVSIVFFVLAVIFIGLAVFIFFARNIPDVQADLSGKKRAQAVEKMGNQRSGRDRRKGVARVEPTTGDLTRSEQIKQSVPSVRSVVTEPEPAQPARQSTAPQQSFQPQAGAAFAASGDDSETAVLTAAAGAVAAAVAGGDDSETTVLPEDAAAVVGDDSETTVLPADAGDDTETTVLPDGDTAMGAPEDDNSATTVLPDDSSETTILPDDDSATTILPDDDAETTILPMVDSNVEQETPVAAEEPIEEITASAPARADFKVVRKIVLMESTKYVQAN